MKFLAGVALLGPAAIPVSAQPKTEIPKPAESIREHRGAAPCAARADAEATNSAAAAAIKAG